MIQSVSYVNNSTPLRKVSFKSNNVTEENEHPSKFYVDSFVKNAKQSTPAFLILTGVWTIIDKKTKNITLQKSLINNLVGFFAPVLIVSSAILAGVENKKTSEK